MLGMDIVDQQVRIFGETLKDLLALGLFQVERDPAFIGVQEKNRARSFPRAALRLGNGPR